MADVKILWSFHNLEACTHIFKDSEKKDVQEQMAGKEQLTGKE